MASIHTKVIWTLGLRAMNLFSYVITYDTGFAPNPFGGFLTLACCKPRIRRVARKGDYIIGTGSKRTIGTTKLIYAAEISDVVSMEDYGKLPKFNIKRPDSDGKWWQILGDNIYEKKGSKWIQRENPDHDESHMEYDLTGINVVICKRFWYFGDHPEELQPRFRELIKTGPGHKRFEETPLIKQFLAWLRKMPCGIRSSDHLRINKSESCSKR